MKTYKTIVDGIEESVTVEQEKFSVGNHTVEIIEYLPQGVLIRLDDKQLLIDDIINLPDQNIIRVEIKGYTIDVSVVDPISEALAGSQKSNGEISSPMSGTISAIRVEVGEEVEKGDVLLMISAMKMENQIISPIDGIVQDIKVNNNEGVPAGKLLIIVEQRE